MIIQCQFYCCNLVLFYVYVLIGFVGLFQLLLFWVLCMFILLMCYVVGSGWLISVFRLVVMLVFFVCYLWYEVDWASCYVSVCVCSTSALVQSRAIWRINCLNTCARSKVDQSRPPPACTWTVCLPHRDTVCVCYKDTVWVSHRDTVCLSHRDTVWCLYSRYMVS